MALLACGDAKESACGKFVDKVKACNLSEVKFVDKDRCAEAMSEVDAATFEAFLGFADCMHKSSCDDLLQRGACSVEGETFLRKAEAVSFRDSRRLGARRPRA